MFSRASIEPEAREGHPRNMSADGERLMQSNASTIGSVYWVDIPPLRAVKQMRQWRLIASWQRQVGLP